MCRNKSAQFLLLRQALLDVYACTVVQTKRSQNANFSIAALCVLDHAIIICLSQQAFLLLSVDVVNVAFCETHNLRSCYFCNAHVAVSVLVPGLAGSSA